MVQGMYDDILHPKLFWRGLEVLSAEESVVKRVFVQYDKPPTLDEKL